MYLNQSPIVARTFSIYYSKVKNVVKSLFEGGVGIKKKSTTPEEPRFLRRSIRIPYFKKLKYGLKDHKTADGPVSRKFSGGEFNPSEHERAMKYRREIDGLRAVAVLAVIFFHAGFNAFQGGYVGVDVFFVISGYLITTIILSDMNNQKFSIVTFYERRARRILPALFLVMLCCLPFAWFLLLPNDLKDFSESLAAVSVFSSNILFWRQSGYFDTASELKPLLHTWSLAVEEQYYILFPVFLMLLWKFRKRLIFAALMVVGIASLAAAEWGAYNKPDMTFFLLPTRAWELAIGALIAFYFLYNRKHAEFIKSRKKASEVLGFVGLLLICYSIFAFDDDTPFPSLYALIPTVGTGLIIIFSTSETAVGRLLGIKAMVGIGLISYSTYLWHYPIFVFARRASLTEPGTTLLLFLSALSVLLGFISWRFVESPFRNKGIISRRKIFSFGAVGSFLFVLIACAGVYTGGFIYRYSGDDLEMVDMSFVENRDKYVTSRFLRLLGKEFDKNDSRPKVLIIGDSYAQDLTNALFEVDFNRQIQLSTHYISKECGNLFIPKSQFEDDIPPGYVGACKEESLFEDKDLRRRMLEADQIWFASSWQDWQSEYIAQSVENVKALTGKKVKVFGRKNFGYINISELLEMTENERIAIRNSVPKKQIDVNNEMKNSLSSENFVDVEKLLCGNDVNTCPIFTDAGELKTFDGTHLTPYGAKYYGSQLIRNGVLPNISSSR